MLERLRDFLKPPSGGNGEEHRLMQLQYLVLIILICFTILLFLFNTIAGTSGDRLSILAALAVEALSFWLLKINQPRASSFVLTYLIWAVLMVSTLTSQGITGTPILGLVLLILMSGLLVGERIAITLGVLTIAGNYWAMLLESNNALTLADESMSLATQWTVQSGYLLLALGLMLLLGRSMRASLYEARDSEQKLRERVAELRQAHAQLEMSEQTLRRREAILEALRFASEHLFRGRSFEQTIPRVLGDLGRATGVDRVYLFENRTGENNKLLTSQRFEWVAAGVKPEFDNPALQNLDLAEAGFERWLDVLSRNDVLKGHVRELPETERALLQQQSILSLLIVPIFVGEDWWGFVGFDETKWEREWSPAEEDALRGAGSILGAAIGRGLTEQALNQSEARYLAILQDQFDLICRYNPIDGQLLFANEAYMRYYGVTQSQIGNLAIWSQVPPERVPGLKAKIASLTVKDPIAVSDSINIRHDGEKRWVQWTERGIFDREGRLVEVQAVGRDIDAEIRLRKELEENLIKTESLAMTDGLTNLLNRRAISDHASAEWQRAQRENRPFSLLVMDLDHLKNINDTHGHMAGDIALTTLANLIRRSMRRYDWAGRWGGDEFLLVLPGTLPRDAAEVAERLRQRVGLARPTLESGEELGLHVSIGVAGVEVPEAGEKLEEIIAEADEALYRAKQAGRDRVNLAQ